MKKLFTSLVLIIFAISFANIASAKTLWQIHIKAIHQNKEEQKTSLRLYGTVYDEKTKAQVDSVEIFDVKTENHTVSDSKGNYSIKLDKNSTEQIVKFKASNYETYTARFQTPTTQDMRLLVYLKASEEASSETEDVKIKLYGRVLDAKTGKTLSNVMITNQFNNSIVYSDSQGSYTATLIEGELNKVVFSIAGYDSYTAKVNSLEDIKLDVRLEQIK